jgi:hypothetical protein
MIAEAIVNKMSKMVSTMFFLMSVKVTDVRVLSSWGGAGGTFKRNTIRNGSE